MVRLGGTEVLEDDTILKSQLISFIEEHFFTSHELEKKLRKNVKQRRRLMVYNKSPNLCFLLLSLCLGRIGSRCIEEISFTSDPIRQNTDQWHSS